MANRQARREQRRTARGGRRTPSGGGAAPGGPGRRPALSSGGGGGSRLPGWLTQPFSLVVAGVVVIAVVGIALVLALGGGDDADAELVDNLESHVIPEALADGTKLGSDDAPIKMVMYEDFQCPFCLNYSGLIEPGLIDEFVTAGTVQIEYRHLPILGTESVQAGLAAECAADQNRFWQYHNALFLAQAEAGQATREQINVGRFSIDNLKSIASDVGGIDRAVFDTCLESQQHLDDVDGDRAEAISLGITGTPGFTLNGSPLPGGAPSSVEGWSTLLNAFLESLNETPTEEPGEGTPTEGNGSTTTPAATAEGDATATAAE